MVSVLHRHLDSYHVLQLVKLTQCLVLLHCRDQELFAKLKMLLLGYVFVLENSVSYLIEVLHSSLVNILNNKIKYLFS